MVGDQPRRHAIDAGGIGDVELDRGHAGIGSDDLIEVGATPTGNDHLVAELVKRLAWPRPMPEPPPVMKMVLLVSFMFRLL
jgi:hypothetical protein